MMLKCELYLRIEKIKKQICDSFKDSDYFWDVYWREEFVKVSFIGEATGGLNVQEKRLAFENAIETFKSCEMISLSGVEKVAERVSLNGRLFSPEFRKKCVSVRGGFPYGSSVKYSLPSDIDDELKTAFSRLNCLSVSSNVFDGKNIARIVKISSRFIVDFLRVHPFENGNGRVARILVAIILAKKITLVPCPIFGSRKVWLKSVEEAMHFGNYELLERLVANSILITLESIVFAFEL